MGELTDLDSYLGLWELLPDASDYGADAPPAGAIYALLSDPNGLFVHARWTDHEGSVSEVAFRCPLGGEGVEAGTGARLHSELTSKGLESWVVAGGVEVHRALRTLEGGKLRVVQTAAGQEPTVGVYRRTAAKQVMVYRRDLKMRKGKIAAQCAHGSMAVFFRRSKGPAEELQIPLDGPMAWWSRKGFAKIVLSCEGEEELLAIAAAAKQAGLPHAVITDSGKTEFHGVPTRTVVAIGPATLPEIDRITGKEGAIPCKLA